MNRQTKSILAALAVLLLAGGLFTVAGADNGLVTCDGPSYETDCRYADGTPAPRGKPGQWYRFNYAGEVYFGQYGNWADKVTDRYGNPFRSDAPAPGVLMGLSSSGQRLMHGVYEGDTWKGQLNNAPPGPLTYRANPGAVFRSNPNSAEDARIVYLADADNRVVRDGGEYYREERINGQWVRSVSYGSDDEARDRAITDARNRSQRDQEPAEPPPSIKLSSTNGQDTNGHTAIGKVGTDLDVAQSFTTGSHASGYKLTSVKLNLWVGTGALPTYTVTIRSNFRFQSIDYPSSTLGTLTAASSPTTGLNTFIASGDGIDLAAGTKYWIVLDITVEATDLVLGIRRTGSNDEDSGGATGWSIEDGFKQSDYNSSVWTDDSRTLKLEIHGYAK